MDHPYQTQPPKLGIPPTRRKPALYSGMTLAAITIETTDQKTFTVTVADRTTTTHIVTVSEDYWQKLTGGRVRPDKLVEESFKFLLEREPNTSILRSFNLSAIQGYFPEFEKTIRSLLK